MPIVIKHKGSFKKTERMLMQMKNASIMDILNFYGDVGVKALASVTPVDTGTTARSWYYEIEPTKKGYRIVWSNSNVNKGQNIAVLIQYGHGTGTGGWVEGIDYINPVIQKVFEDIAEKAWEEVLKT